MIHNHSRIQKEQLAVQNPRGPPESSGEYPPMAILIIWSFDILQASSHSAEPLDSPGHSVKLPYKVTNPVPPANYNIHDTSSAYILRPPPATRDGRCDMQLHPARTSTHH